MKKMENNPGYFGMEKRFPKAAGFSLVEIVMALGIFSFVVVTVLGTMAVALNSTRDSEMKLRAAHVGTSIIGAVKANPSYGATVANFPLPDLTDSKSDLQTKGTAEGGTATGSPIYIDLQGRTVASGSAAAFQLSWRLTQDQDMPQLVYCYLQMSWPPGAAAGAATGSHKVASSILLPP